MKTGSVSFEGIKIKTIYLQMEKKSNDTACNGYIIK